MTLADLLDEFNVVIDTTEGLTELRSLILGLAVRGKLIPQDSNDEPASELLIKIEQEKDTFYEENNVRVPKIDPINEKDLKRSKPDQWEVVRLFDLYDFEYGKSLPKRKRNNNGQIPVFGSNGVIGNHDEPLITTPAIIIGRKGSVGALNVCRESFWPTDVTYYVCPYADMSIEYSYYHLLSLNLEELGKGIKPGLTRNEAYELITLLPPLEEQNRIVQKIESLFEEVDELEEKLNRQTKLDEKLQLAVNADVQQAKDADASKSAWTFITSNFDTFYHTSEAIDNLKKNILNEAVRGRLVSHKRDHNLNVILSVIDKNRQELSAEGERRIKKKRKPVEVKEFPWSVPDHWKWVRFADFILFIDYRGKTPKKVKSGVRLITAKNIKDGFVKFDPKEFIKENEYDKWMTRGIPKKGDLLFTTEAPLGHIAVLDFDFKFALAQRAICFRLLHEDINPYYIMHFMMSDTFKKYLISHSTGMTAKGIKSTLMKKLPFPLPPLEEQHSIVRRIEELFAICDQFKAQLEQREKVNERLVKGLVDAVLKKT